MRPSRTSADTVRKLNFSELLVSDVGARVRTPMGVG